MKNQNIKVKLSMVAMLSMIVSSGCVQVRNMPTSTAATAPGPHFAQAEAFEANRAFDRAAESYLAITQNFPQSATAPHRLAICLDKQGLTTQSKPYYLQALKLDPNNANLHCDFGYSSYLQGDLAQAEQSYQTAIRLDANNSRAHNNLAHLLAQTSRMTEAVHYYQLAGCNAEQIKQNISFATTGNAALAMAVSKPEPQAKLAEITVPTPVSPQTVQSALKRTSQVQVPETDVENKIPVPQKVVVADNLPLPLHNVNYASYEKPANVESRATTEFSTQHSSRRVPGSANFAQPSPKAGFQLSDSQ